jgi:hypothetical protein
MQCQLATGNCHGEAASNKMELEQCELMGEREHEISPPLFSGTSQFVFIGLNNPSL